MSNSYANLKINIFLDEGFMKYLIEFFKKINILIDWQFKDTMPPISISASIMRIPTDKGYRYYIYHNCETFKTVSWKNLDEQYKYYIPLGYINETNPKEILKHLEKYLGVYLPFKYLFLGFQTTENNYNEIAL